MNLTGLEAALLGGAIGTGSIIIATALNQFYANRRLAKQREKFLTSVEFSNQTKACAERFERGDKKMEDTSTQIKNLSKMFERFIIYSELPADVKAKIINGDGGNV